MDLNTVRAWAIIDGIYPRTATKVRERLGIGVKIGKSWLITKEEWSAIKSQIKYFRKRQQ